MKTQIIIHQDIIERLIMEYVETQCHDAFEVSYNNRKGAFECKNPYAITFPFDGLVFSLKNVEGTPAAPSGGDSEENI